MALCKGWTGRWTDRLEDATAWGAGARADFRQRCARDGDGHRGGHLPGGSKCAGGLVGRRAAHHVVLQLRGMGTGMARGRRDLEPRQGQARLKVPHKATMSVSGLVPLMVPGRTAAAMAVGSWLTEGRASK